MLTLVSSLIQYTAALVILCWGLSILGVESLENSGVVLRFTSPVSEEQIFQAQRILNRELLLGLRHLGVECPFPQVDVHMR